MLNKKKIYISSRVQQVGAQQHGTKMRKLITERSSRNEYAKVQKTYVANSVARLRRGPRVRESRKCRAQRNEPGCRRAARACRSRWRHANSRNSGCTRSAAVDPHAEPGKSSESVSCDGSLCSLWLPELVTLSLRCVSESSSRARLLSISGVLRFISSSSIQSPSRIAFTSVPTCKKT